MLEDDSHMAVIVECCLAQDGQLIDRVATLEAARSLVGANDYDLYILERDLPDGTGLDFCGAERERGLSIAVLMLTAKAASGNKVEALDGGADD